jgi:hypothetical protein
MTRRFDDGRTLPLFDVTYAVETAAETFASRRRAPWMHDAALLRTRLALMSGGRRLVSLSQLCVKRRDCRGFLLGFANGIDAKIEHAAAQVAALIRSSARAPV